MGKRTALRQLRRWALSDGEPVVRNDESLVEYLRVLKSRCERLMEEARDREDPLDIPYIIEAALYKCIAACLVVGNDARKALEAKK